MSIQRTLIALAAAAAALYTSTAPAQTNISLMSTDNLFRVTFSGFGRVFDAARGRIVTTRTTDQDIVSLATGMPVNNRRMMSNFALVYNATEDSLQVVGTNGLPLVDVIHFGGGTAINDGFQTDRFTLMFFPGQTNEVGLETNIFGSALLTERSVGAGFGNNTNRINLSGTLQYVLTGTNLLGTTNVFILASTNAPGTNASGTNVTGVATAASTSPGPGFYMTNSDITFDNSAQVYNATFFATRRFVPFATIMATNITTGITHTTTGTTNTTTGTTNTTAGTTNTTTSTTVATKPTVAAIGMRASAEGALAKSAAVTPILTERLTRIERRQTSPAPAPGSEPAPAPVLASRRFRLERRLQG
jgi:hypothetical protein